MLSRRAGLALLVLVWLLPASPALGETGSKLEPPQLSRYVKWGPLRVRPRLTVSNLGYDDNILLGTNEQVSDYRATVSPQIDGLVLFGSRAFLTFRERFDFTSYLENQDQNSVNQRGTARMTLPLRRIGLFATVDIDRTESRPEDLDDQRLRRKLDGYGLGTILSPGWRTEIEVEWSDRNVRHTDPDADDVEDVVELDRTEQRAELRLSYRLLGRTDVTLDTERRRVDFDTPFRTASGPVDRDSEAWSVSPGLAFGEDGPLFGLVRLGWSEIDIRDDGLRDFSELIGELDLAYRTGAGWLLRFEAERQPRFSLYQDNTYYLGTDLGLRAIHYFHRAVGVELGVTRGRLEFPEPERSAASIRREDTTERAEIGLRLRLFENGMGRRVEYSLKFGRYHRESNVVEDRSQNTVGLNAVLGF